MIPFVDLNAQYSLIENDLRARIDKVFNHGKFILGPEVIELEGRLAEYVGVGHCITTSSGTDGLLIALMAMDIGPGDEVITTPFSFIATAEVILLLGAIPVFVDIDPETYVLDPENIRNAITPKTKAIMPVSIFGQCADMRAINNIASNTGLVVIEDAAQSFGATYKARRSCGLSDIGVTSFFPTKPLGCFGDGGAVFTDDNRLADDLRMLRAHGQQERYKHSRIGINGRLDTMQAAILLSKLAIFDDEIDRRREVAERYDSLFGEVDEKIIRPVIPAYNSSVYAQYTIQSGMREKLIGCMKEKGIPAAVHYPLPLFEQEALVGQSRQSGDMQVVTEISKRVLSLPMHPYLEPKQQKQIVDVVACCLAD